MKIIKPIKINLWKSLCVFLTVSLIITAIPFSKQSVSATTYDSAVNTNVTYYIKNMFSGKYLDVKNGKVADGTNIIQYDYKGATNQKWKLVHKGNGIYEIVSALNSNYVLDVVNGNTGDGVNILLWKRNNGKGQRFNVARTSNGTYKILTQNTSYKRGVVVQNSSCANGANVFQWGYSNNAQTNDEWMLEPATDKSITLAINYAKTNYNKRPKSFPDMNSTGGDCTNFVSQALMAYGYHHEGDWFVKKKNATYHKPANNSQLNSSWKMTFLRSSPWVSAQKFHDFWSKKRKTESFNAKSVLSNPSIAFNRSFYPGDVIQYMKPGDKADHTMYITGTTTYKGKSTYTVTYHTNDRLSKPLTQFLEESNPGSDYKVKFFDFT